VLRPAGRDPIGDEPPDEPADPESDGEWRHGPSRR
jgi:hypothetical protein